MKSKKPFIKFNSQNEKVSLLLARRPQAFALLALIAKRAKRNDDPSTGLKKGEAIVSDFKSYGATRQSHKTNLSTLKINQQITTRIVRLSTSQVTVAKLVSKDIFDINLDIDNQSTKQSTNLSPTSEVKKSIPHHAVNQPQTKNIRNKEKEYKNTKAIEIFISHFNDKFGSSHRVLDGRRMKLGSRLKKFSLEEMLRAIDNCSKDRFCRGENDRRWIANPDYLLRSDEQIDKWLVTKNDLKRPQSNLPSEVPKQTPEEKKMALEALERVRQATSFLASSKSVNNLSSK